MAPQFSFVHFLDIMSDHLFTSASQSNSFLIKTAIPSGFVLKKQSYARHRESV